MKKKAEKLPRFAFLTKSDNEQLEDGYRWRKYGQKNVKNSPHPRYVSLSDIHACSGVLEF